MPPTSTALHAVKPDAQQDPKYVNVQNQHQSALLLRPEFGLWYSFQSILFLNAAAVGEINTQF
ncbi:hypothetical protein D3C71_2175790 [compost metagenome]